jgi:hypothetical protein
VAWPVRGLEILTDIPGYNQACDGRFASYQKTYHLLIGVFFAGICLNCFARTGVGCSLTYS